MYVCMYVCISRLEIPESDADDAGADAQNCGIRLQVSCHRIVDNEDSKAWQSRSCLSATTQAIMTLRVQDSTSRRS
jgi:hypothetical protein